MKHITLILLFLTNIGLWAQTTYVPDDNFEQALIDLGYDVLPLDDYVPTANISGVTDLNVSDKGISDLTGIEGFVALEELRCGENRLTTLDLSNNTALTTLFCSWNQLTSLDVTNNTALTYLDCHWNQLTSLDVTNNTALTVFYCNNNQLTSLDVANNTALTRLYCESNQLTSLDVTNNTALTSLFCHWNQLTSLDVTKNTALTYLRCRYNQLTSLDVTSNTALTVMDCNNNQLTSLDIRNGNNANITEFEATGNPDLGCIYVDDKTAVPSGWEKDATANYVNDIDGCRALVSTYVPDDNFEQALIDLGYDVLPLDDYVPTANISGVTVLNVPDKGISDLTGIEGFVALEELRCWENRLTTLDLSNNTALTKVSCSGNQLTSLDISKNTALTIFYCKNNQLTSLDIRNCNNAIITNFSATGNPYLGCIYVDDKTAVPSGWEKDATANYVNDIDGCRARGTFVPNDNFEQALIDLGLDEGPLDNYVPTAKINEITSLDVSDKEISDLTGIKDFVALTYLSCSGNQLTSLDVTNNTALTYLRCSYNQLTSLDVTNNTALTYLDCDNNQLTSLDVTNNTALTVFYCNNNQLTSLDIRNGNNAIITNFRATGNPDLSCIYVDDKTAVPNYWKKDPTANFINDIDECMSLDGTYVPDDNFEQALIDLGLDEGPLDDYVPTAKISEITSLDVSEKGISDLTGIEGFVALTNLKCNYNELTSLDVSKNTALTNLECYSNQLTSLYLTKNTALTYLECYRNQLTSLDVSKNTALTYLDCKENQLASLDVSKNTALLELRCWTNQLTSLDVSQNVALTKLYCSSNQLAGLDISKNTTLTALGCRSNSLTSIDVSNNTALKHLNCGENQISGIDVAINTALTEFYCDGNQLSSLDVSKNTALERLDCRSNKLGNLDVTNNVTLERLFSSDNELTSLDVSKNTALIALTCGTNKLSNLDVTNNRGLFKLYCYSNPLTKLDIRNGNNANITDFDATGNPDLGCIYVDDKTAVPNDWKKDATANYANNETECTPLSVGEIEGRTSFGLYPNPVSEQFSIQTNKKVEFVKLFNASGLLAKEFSKQDSYPVSGLPCGAYYVKIYCKEGIYTKKIIVE